MKKVFVTRPIPEVGINMLRQKGYEVTVSSKDRSLTKKELMKVLKKTAYDGVLCELTDTIDAEVLATALSVKIFANYAVGFNNIDTVEAKKLGIAVTNTPGVLTESVAEHTIALMLAIANRIVEADNFLRKGKYKEWGPMLLLGTELSGKTLGILGAGRIGSRVAEIAQKGLSMKVIYYDVAKNEQMEKTVDARFCPTVDEVLKEADVVSIHVPLLDSTRHLINKEKLAIMKTSGYLVNTSRGPVIDENALVSALQNKIIRGAALDVFEFEPKLAKGLSKLSNVVITPHIASATETARDAMSKVAAENLIAFFESLPLPNRVV